MYTFVCTLHLQTTKKNVGGEGLGPQILRYLTTSSPYDILSPRLVHESYWHYNQTKYLKELREGQAL